MTPGDVAALLAQGQREEALAAAAREVNENPQDAGWRVVLGAVLVEMQQLAEGEKVLLDALRMAPDSPEALFNLSVALRRQGRTDEQVDALARIHPAWPGAGRVHADLSQAGLMLLMSGRHEAAVRAYRALLAIQPGARPALYNMALALAALGRHDDVAAVIREAFAAGHRDAELLAMLANAKGMACDWESLDAVVEQLRVAAREPGSRPPHPQASLYMSQVTPAEQKQWAEAFSRTIYAGLEPVARPARAPSDRLRVGYVSSDFRDHAVAWLVVGLLENHDRERFEVFAYSTAASSAPSAVGARIAQAVEHPVNASRMTGREIAERIAADGIDVLVDLGGHTQGARLDVLAYRPAPIQVHFIGYAGTTGADFIDFLVADDVTVPAGAEGAYSETVLRLDHCYMPGGDPARPVPQPADRARIGLPKDAIVLCSFNQAIKLRPDVFADWCALLQQLPNAVLMLGDPGEPARQRLVAAAARWRVDSRLMFAPHLPRDEHTARLAAADIALDTFPYTSHTTTIDALWAGLPIITTPGETFASRVSASLLHTAGLDEWIFQDRAKAFQAIIALASDPAALAAAKEKARAARSSALFDAAGFARDFERMLLTAAGRHAA